MHKIIMTHACIDRHNIIIIVYLSAYYSLPLFLLLEECPEALVDGEGPRSQHLLDLAHVQGALLQQSLCQALYVLLVEDHHLSGTRRALLDQLLNL
jgi:hypothetical protein